MVFPNYLGALYTYVDGQHAPHYPRKEMCFIPPRTRFNATFQTIVIIPRVLPYFERYERLILRRRFGNDLSSIFRADYNENHEVDTSK
jgi:hypothetical protein